MHRGSRPRGPAQAAASLFLVAAAIAVTACGASPASQPPGGDGGGNGGPPVGTGGASTAAPATVAPTTDGTGTWSLVLTGGSKPGEYSGRDVMQCLYLVEDSRWTVGFRPVHPIISRVAAHGPPTASLQVTVKDEDDNPLDYFTLPDAPASVLEGPTVSDGFLSVKVEGDGALLTANCPITE